jgi:hypothetical protein
VPKRLYNLQSRQHSNLQQLRCRISQAEQRVLFLRHRMQHLPISWNMPSMPAKLCPHQQQLPPEITLSVPGAKYQWMHPLRKHLHSQQLHLFAKPGLQLKYQL